MRRPYLGSFLTVIMVVLSTTMMAEGHGEGRKLTDYASTPKFGAYFIGKYAYSDKDGAHGATASVSDSSVHTWTAPSLATSNTVCRHRSTTLPST